MGVAALALLVLIMLGVVAIVDSASASSSTKYAGEKKADSSVIVINKYNEYPAPRVQEPVQQYQPQAAMSAAGDTYYTSNYQSSYYPYYRDYRYVSYPYHNRYTYYGYPYYPYYGGCSYRYCTVTPGYRSGSYKQPIWA